MRIEHAATVTELSANIADSIVEIFVRRQQDGQIPCLILTGGSMGEACLHALNAHPMKHEIDWEAVRFLWGDERWVPAGHADRNDKLADDLLFSHVNVNPSLVHRVRASDSGISLDEAASEYADIYDALPHVDIALNGVGPDGHLCSLFPGREDLLREDENTPSVIAARHCPKPPPERVTLTLPALRKAERIWLLAAGATKAEAVSAITHPESSPLPAARIAPHKNTVLWADHYALQNC